MLGLLALLLLGVTSETNFGGVASTWKLIINCFRESSSWNRSLMARSPMLFIDYWQNSDAAQTEILVL